MEAEVNENLKFTGRIVAQHDTQNNERICILSENITASSSNAVTTFDIDKTYMDYNVNREWTVPVIFSMGILPTTGGLSSNIIEDTSRRSVFPSLIFDTTSYGAIVSANLSKVLGMKNTWLRAVEAKAFTMNAGLYYYQCNRETYQNGDIESIFLETTLPALGDNTAYIGFVGVADIKATPYLGSSSASFDIKRADPMGEIYTFGSGIELRNIAKTGLDLFAHAAISMPDGNGEIMDFQDKLDGNGGFTTALYATGPLLQENGYAYYVGAKYKIKPINGKVGVEFNHGSKYWWSATQGSEDVFNKLAVRGNVLEAYYIQHFNSNFSARVGYYRAQESHTGSGWHFGTPVVKNDAIQQNYYVTLDAKF